MTMPMPLVERCQKYKQCKNASSTGRALNLSQYFFSRTKKML